MEKDKNKKIFRKETILVWFIAFIMISSVFGVVFYGFSQANTSLKYNNFKFIQKDNFWTTKINKIETYFNYFPAEIEKINLTSDINSRLKNTLEIDMTYDLNDSYSRSIAGAQYELERVLNQHTNLFIRKGFVKENKFNMPVITCVNATAVVPVMYLKKSNSTEIVLENNCIIASIKREEDAFKIKDRVLYSILGVIN